MKISPKSIQRPSYIQLLITPSALLSKTIHAIFSKTHFFQQLWENLFNKKFIQDVY